MNESPLSGLTKLCVKKQKHMGPKHVVFRVFFGYI